MRFALYGTPKDCSDFHTLLDAAELRFFNSTEEWLPAICGERYEAIFVLASGAEGMEAAIAARRQQPAIPLVWFSDDREFAAQAYRLNAAYFATKPVTGEKLQAALRHCGLIS